MAAIQAITAKASFCQRLIVGVLPYRSSYDSPSIVSSAQTRHQETAGEIIQVGYGSTPGVDQGPASGWNRRMFLLAAHPGEGRFS
jgi:hypothetical protein